MAPLIEAKRDRRLHEREEASLDRHLAGCASCRALEHNLSRLAEAVRRPLMTSRGPLDHQRGRVRLLREAALGDVHPRPSPRRVPLFALAGLLATAALLLLARPTQPRPLTATAQLWKLVPRIQQFVEAGAQSAPGTRLPAKIESTVGASAAAARPLPRAATPPRGHLKRPAHMDAVTREPDAAKAFAEGVALLDRADYATAAAHLEAFRVANPGDTRAEDAAYLVIIALQRAGGRDAAAEMARAARRYLELYPASPRRRAVQAILDNP